MVTAFRQFMPIDTSSRSDLVPSSATYLSGDGGGGGIGGGLAGGLGGELGGSVSEPIATGPSLLVQRKKKPSRLTTLCLLSI